MCRISFIVDSVVVWIETPEILGIEGPAEAPELSTRANLLHLLSVFLC